MATSTTPHGRVARVVSGRALDRSIAARYASRGQRAYVRGKLAGDPVYAAAARIVAHAPPLPLLDIGCGMGLLGQYLHAQGLLHGYLGVDHDPRKVDAARHAAATLDENQQWLHADVAQLPPFQGHVALLDMLHYLPADRQAALLTAVAARLARGGRLLIRNVLRAPGWRYRATRIEEYFLRVSGWMSVGAQHYPSADDIRSPLERAGLSVHVAPLYGHTPFNSYLVLAHRIH